MVINGTSKEPRLAAVDLPLVAEPGRLSASAVCTGGKSGSCVKKRRRGSGNPCLRATPNQKLTREIILLEVIFGVDDGVVRWGRRHVSSGFSKRRPTSFTMVKTRRGTRGFLHRARRKTKGKTAPTGVDGVVGDGLDQPKEGGAARRLTMILATIGDAGKTGEAFAPAGDGPSGERCRR
ncbi:hypothetical protein LR48_Vigan06g098100 [Vigna angularis]|uniref:Uncharacterized protein n=1 Tax=Phaseolus angularis TaxID=3914 RepID=A0A0L9US25_PHAAN|nr:hypothetical protein LR48_Vigan06g098100 [Vigna angularis]